MKHGGLYAPEMTVVYDRYDKPIAPVTMPAVYASIAVVGRHNKIDRGDWDTSLADMKQKIVNVLRFCHSKGHRILIITSQFHSCDPQIVAKLFQELLIEAGDLKDVFQQVIFTISPHDVNAEATYKAFKTFFAEVSYETGFVLDKGVQPI